MAESIRDLKDYLDSTKGGTNPAAFTDDELQELIDYINAMVTIRGSDPLPTDDGTDLSGTDCTVYTGATLANAEPYSISDFTDWQASSNNLPTLTCNAQTYTSSWCTSRTACDALVTDCVDNVVCNCDLRTACVSNTVTCSTDVACVCDNRTACVGYTVTCSGRSCSCVRQDVPTANTCTTYSGCYCKARFIVCNCRDRCACNARTCSCQSRYTCTCYSRECDCEARTCDCQSRYTCTCYSRECDCEARTCDCQSRAGCTCESRTSCDCDARCQCNTVDVYA